MKTLKLLNICLIIWVCTVLGEELHFWYLINHRIKIYVEHFCLTNFWVFLLRYKAFWILITCHLYVVPHFHHNYIVWWWLFGLCAGALQDVLHLHDVLARVSLAKLCCTISRARALDGWYIKKLVFNENWSLQNLLWLNFCFACMYREIRY